MDLGLQERVYVVTGASQGLGRACAQVLVDEGARVVVCSRDEEALVDLAASLGGREHALPVSGDLAVPGLETQLVATAIASWGRLDGALVSVGGPPAGRATDVDDAAWRVSFETLFLGSVRVMRAVGRASTVEGSSVVLVLSTSVRSPVEGLAISNGLRPGLAMVAKSFADELGPAGVRVNAVLPGRFDTDRVRHLDASAGDAEETRRRREAGIPLGRYGEPSELARPAVFLLSPAASYVTGTVLTVDGGATRAL